MSSMLSMRRQGRLSSKIFINAHSTNNVDTHNLNACDVENDMYALAVSYTVTYKWPVFPLISDAKNSATGNGFKMHRLTRNSCATDFQRISHHTPPGCPRKTRMNAGLRELR